MLKTSTDKPVRQAEPTERAAELPRARGAEAPVAPSADSPGPRGRAEAGGGERAAPWHADEGLMSAMGLGAPLPEQTRRTFEASLDADLSGVRVHTGEASASAAGQLGAAAFATGQDIHFGAGRYQPDSPAGKHLLAHEVAHTVQQGSGSAATQCKDEVSQPGDALEGEADRAADAMVRGEPAAVSRGAARLIQRQVSDEASGDGAAEAASSTEGPMSSPSSIDPPAAGNNGPGFIDHGDGSNIRNRPAELADSIPLTTAPLPPATRVYVSGVHPDTAEWLYVTAFLPEAVVRGYVQHFRVTTALPEPGARLYQIAPGDTAEGLAQREFSSSVRDGHDLRYYENVLLHVNREAGRPGITGEFQSPEVLGGGANNIQLVAGERIWLVSAAFAAALESIVPDGSLTNGAVAGARRVVGHLEDILASVDESPQYLGEVAGEYAQAILDNWPQIVGITAGFIAAELASVALAATPTGVGQIIAVLIQLSLAAFGAVGVIEAGIQALQHGERWLTTAWTCNGDPLLRAEASRSFLRMMVAIAIAALSAYGARGNFGNAARIADNIHITPPTIGMSPAMVTPDGVVFPGGPTFTPGSIATTGPVDISPVFMSSIGSGTGATSMSARANGLGHRARTLREAVESLPDDAPGKWDMLQRARDLEAQAQAVRELAAESAEAADALASDIQAVEDALSALEREVVDAMPVTAPASTVPRPHLDHPANQLPINGTHPYEPPTYAGAGEYVPARGQAGYMDRYGNRWEWARDAHGGPHWDVQHPNDTHTNVYPDGEVHQGEDLF